MGSSCSGVQHKRRVSMDSLFPIANIDLRQATKGTFCLEDGQILRDEDISRAVDDFQTLSKQFPEDRRIQLYLGIGLYLTGFREAAITPLRAGIQAHGPEVAKGCYILGAIYFGKGNLAAARTFLEKGLSYRSEDIGLLLKLSELNLLEKDFKSALQQAKAALQLHPGNWEAHSLSGQSHLGLGAVDEAIHSLKSAVSIYDKSFKTYFALGNAYRRKEKVKEAIACFRESISLSQDTRFFLHYFSLATLYLETDHVIEALDHFRRGQNFGQAAEKLMQEKGFDIMFSPSELPNALEIMYSGNVGVGDREVKRIADESRSAVAYFYLGVSLKKQDDPQSAKGAFMKCILFLQSDILKPLQEFFFNKATQELKDIDAPTEENLALGEIDEEHSRGSIKELNTHSTPLSQSQSPDHSFSLGRDGKISLPGLRTLPAEGFKVRAESLENSHTPKRVRAPSPGETLYDEEGKSMSPRGAQSSLRKFMPKVEADPANCEVF